MSTFIDNIKIMNPKNFGIILKVKIKLTIAFKMSDMGPIEFYLGLKIDKNCDKMIIKLFQPIYI